MPWLGPQKQVDPGSDNLLLQIGRLFGALQSGQETRGVHTAALAEGEALLVVVEDVGRHNAVDKVVGRLLLDGSLPATGLGLFVSGRASFELVQKAWAAGFSTLVAAVRSNAAPSTVPAPLQIDPAKVAEGLPGWLADWGAVMGR